MTQTLAEIQHQIAELQAAERRLRGEAAEVISKIKVAIDAYGLTPADLFDGAPASLRPAVRVAEGAKFSDGNGNVWGGRGPRPIWLRDALAQGRSLSEFAVGRARDGAIAGVSSHRGENKRTVAIKYRDGNNVWSGRGSQPRWLRSAIDTGRTLDDFKV